MNVQVKSSTDNQFGRNADIEVLENGVKTTIFFKTGHLRTLMVWAVVGRASDAALEVAKECVAAHYGIDRSKVL